MTPGRPEGLRITAIDRSLSCSLHSDQLHFEEQRGARRDDRGAAPVAIGEGVRDDQQAFFTWLHIGDAQIPAFDDLTGAEAELVGLAAIEGTVEFRSVPERPGIVYGNIGAGLGFFPFAFLFDEISEDSISGRSTHPENVP